MNALLWFACGLIAYRVWVRVILRVFRHFVGGDRSERIRKDMFQRMPYDSLLRIQTALGAEIARRRA